MIGSLVGVYRVLAPLGEGGMGTVWLAEHTMLGRRAAIKLLRPMYTAQPEIVKRFFNEARAATAIADPGIVQVFDFGYHSDGSAYIAMEVLDGEPLDRRLARLGRLPVGESLRILRQVASTLGVTHARGIVHRDLKPENIFLVPDPEVPGGERSKILDFGIAKLTGDASLKTNTSAVLGTPAFMSPEQCRGAGGVDQRTDVYAMGCVLFVLLTGRTPFEAEGPGDLIAMHLREPPPPPSNCAPGIPPEIDALVLRCLAKDPAQRFASGAELAAELGRLLGTPLTHVAPVVGALTSSQHAKPAAATTLSLRGASFKLSTSSRNGWIAGFSLLAVGGVIAAMAMSQERPTSDPSDAPTKPAATDPVKENVGPAAPTPALDPSGALAGQVTSVLAAFVEWSRANPGARCPEIAALGPIPVDPWGQAFALTCTEQPEDHVVGAISSGPDRKLGTPDDRVSWKMADEVTALVRGKRWTAKVAPAPANPAKKKAPPKPADPYAIPRAR